MFHNELFDSGILTFMKRRAHLYRLTNMLEGNREATWELQEYLRENDNEATKGQQLVNFLEMKKYMPPQSMKREFFSISFNFGRQTGVSMFLLKFCNKVLENDNVFFLTNKKMMSRCLMETYDNANRGVGVSGNVKFISLGQRFTRLGSRVEQPRNNFFLVVDNSVSKSDLAKYIKSNHLNESDYFLIDASFENGY